MNLWEIETQIWHLKLGLEVIPNIQVMILQMYFYLIYSPKLRQKSTNTLLLDLLSKTKAEIY